MNQELAASIRTAISETINQLRPPVMGVGLPEPIRTALQAHLDSLLKAEREALTQQAENSDSSMPISSNAQSRSVFETLWLRATKDLEGATALVQNNPEFFGARCRDDKIKVVGEFFVKWAAEKLQPHAELRQTWEPGQKWQTRQRGQKEWIHIAGHPLWQADQEYRQCE